ncbi:Scr1 family TA system antitoxin-like transcriptional regulator [Streptomyces sp. NPDC020192]|uniref:Scr1 family TA system antitoxin-like transcriptional regulator n=1 Tax=Streptomyces sp. NPDC020192 TaxID=3365066 RepID=UPI0037BA75ED
MRTTTAGTLEAELRVAHRMKRRQVFERPHPLPCVAHVHEAALRMPYGGAEVTRRQPKHLADQSERATIDVRIICFSRLQTSVLSVVRPSIAA